MNCYVVDISKSTNVKEGKNKTVENLIEEYKKLLIKNEDYEFRSAFSFFFYLVIAVYVVFFSNLSLLIISILLLLLSMFFFYLIAVFSSKEKEKKLEIKEMKMKLLTILKQEKFIIEHNKDFVLYSRDFLLLQAKKNKTISIKGQNIETQELLLKKPNIQKIIERKTSFEFLKVHNIYQKLINKLCEEETGKKIIYQT